MSDEFADMLTEAHESRQTKAPGIHWDSGGFLVWAILGLNQ
jgi:hypothetical protein